MKVNVKKEPVPPFQPVSITLNFETQKELDAFGSLMNYTKVTDALATFAGHDLMIWKYTSEAGADQGSYNLEQMIALLSNKRS